MPAPIIIIHPRDNVAVALRDLKSGESVQLPDHGLLALLTDIPYSHKVALTDMPQGTKIIKYGECIGSSQGNIRKGEWVHTHNLTIEEN